MVDAESPLIFTSSWSVIVRRGVSEDIPNYHSGKGMTRGTLGVPYPLPVTRLRSRYFLGGRPVLLGAPVAGFPTDRFGLPTGWWSGDEPLRPGRGDGFAVRRPVSDRPSGNSQFLTTCLAIILKRLRTLDSAAFVGDVLPVLARSGIDAPSEKVTQ